MEASQYLMLYRLQDRVLETIFSGEHGFYLTGGTALNRFYKEVRYSEDLDLFSNDDINFYDDIDTIFELLQRHGIEYRLDVKSRDFFRIFAKQDDIELKIDFVNDRVKHFKRLHKQDGIVLDSLENIFANKLTALIGRDEAKDVVDIWLLDRFFNCDTKQIIGYARDKMFFAYEDLVYRLYTFPLEWIERVDFVEEVYREMFLREYRTMCDRWRAIVEEM